MWFSHNRGFELSAKHILLQEMDDKGRGWFTEVIRAGANHLSRHNTIYRVLPMNGSISHEMLPLEVFLRRQRWSNGGRFPLHLRNVKDKETARTSSCFEPQHYVVNKTALTTCFWTKLIGAFVLKSPFFRNFEKINCRIYHEHRWSEQLGAEKAPSGFSLASLLQSSHSVWNPFQIKTQGRALL